MLDLIGSARPPITRRRLLAGLGGVVVAAAPLVRTATAHAATDPPPAVLPPPADILAVVRKVNDHWAGAHSDPGDNQWNRATYFSGAMALYRTTADPGVLAYVRRWAERANYGLHGGTATRHADNHTAGQVYYDLHDVNPDAAQLTAINESIRLMVYGSQPTKVNDWTWVDALHMAMPVFARVAAYRADDTYLTQLYSRYQYTKKTLRLYDYGYERWYRDHLVTPPNGTRSPNGKPVFWSRGNGWAFAAHVKTLGLLPPGESRWPEYRSNIQGLARSLRATQRPDGFWNVNLGDPDHRPGPESSGTAFFAYGLAYGIRAGLLDRATYLPVAARAWNALVGTAVHADGFLGYVQGVGSGPESSQPVTINSTADFGVGAFLLAGTQVARLAA